MDDFVSRVFTDLVGRMEGPMKLRLIIQPLVAVCFAVRAGVRDAREGRSPCFWALAFNTGHRRELLGQGWKDIAKLFVAAVLLDVIYQFIALRTVYPGEANRRSYSARNHSLFTGPRISHTAFLTIRRVSYERSDES